MSFHAIATWNDEARRQIGRVLDAVGLGPHETRHRIVADLRAARLRAYQDAEPSEAPVVLIIPAPFKRAFTGRSPRHLSVQRRFRRGWGVCRGRWTAQWQFSDSLDVLGVQSRHLLGRVLSLNRCRPLDELLGGSNLSPSLCVGREVFPSLSKL